MRVPVHQHHAAYQGAQPANKPAAVDQRRADTHGQRGRRARIFDGMVMKPDNDHPLADGRVAEAFARVLSRYWVDAASGVEVILTHRGANIAYLARATGCAMTRPFRKLPYRSSGERPDGFS
jgi:hypothetical protein